MLTPFLVTMTGRLDAVAELLWPGIAGKVGCAIRVTIDEQSQSFDLLRIQDAIEHLVEVFDGHQLARRNIAKIGPCSQEDGPVID